jgi:heme/copper-type cytochrome/quinol oxidase subunit 2
MRFDWVNILATVIFVSIVVTLILAVASYFAYKVREARRPKTAAELRQEGQMKVFFNQYNAGSAGPTSGTTAARTERK